MLITHTGYQKEKFEIARYYVGEMCDIMAYYYSQKRIVILAYLIALLLKYYNTYFVIYLELHIEAKQKNLKVLDMIRLKYYTFFTETLRDSEKTDFFSRGYPFYVQLFNIKYITTVLLCLVLGLEQDDNNLINVSLICLFDLASELLG